MLTSIDFAQFIRVSRRLESIPAMSSIAALPPIAQAEFCVVSRRNDSLGPRARWTLFASSGGVRTRREFNRCWTRLEVDDGAPARASRLALRSEGESIRFGDALPVHERGSLARELRRVLARR